MAPNFSNRGVHTFDPDNDYLGLRLQQGVPLLDRDWNELNDIRVHLDRTLRRIYLGDGVPDLTGFEIGPLGSGAADDVLIGPGHCLVDGYDVVNRQLLAFSEQGDQVPLPPGQRMTLYLEPEIRQLGEVDRPELGNPQDINLETCLRDQLTWAVRVVRSPAIPPPTAYPLAEIVPDQAGAPITEQHITDLRRTGLNLATTTDDLRLTVERVEALRVQVLGAIDRIEEMQRDLDRIFWQVRVTPARRSALFGGRVGIDIQVTDRRGAPIQGAHIGLSADWGTVSLASSVTDADGRVSAELVGVDTDVDVRPSDVASHEGVLLLHAEPALVLGVLLGDRPQRGAGVGRVRIHLGIEDLAEHELVVAAADRILDRVDRLEYAVGLAAGCLVRRRTIKTPDRRLGARVDHFGLGAHQRRGLRTVQPDVFASIFRHISLLLPRGHSVPGRTLLQRPVDHPPGSGAFPTSIPLDRLPCSDTADFLYRSRQSVMKRHGNRAWIVILIGLAGACAGPEAPPADVAEALAAPAWGQFRGPQASGRGEGASLPTQWDGETGENIAWSTPIPGLAHSSPIVAGDRIFVTTAVNVEGDSGFKPGLYGSGDAAGDRVPHRFTMLRPRSGQRLELLWESVVHEGVPAGQAARQGDLRQRDTGDRWARRSSRCSGPRGCSP